MKEVGSYAGSFWWFALAQICSNINVLPRGRPCKMLNAEAFTRSRLAKTRAFWTNNGSPAFKWWKIILLHVTAVAGQKCSKHWSNKQGDKTIQPTKIKTERRAWVTTSYKIPFQSTSPACLQITNNHMSHGCTRSKKQEETRLHIFGDHQLPWMSSTSSKFFWLRLYHFHRANGVCKIG